MNKKHPKVDVLIPVYGVEQFIEKCLSSVLSQEYDNMRVVLIDDASPDKSIEIAEKIIQGKNTQGHQVEIYRRSINGGIGAVREQLLSLIKGEYILFIDSDDYWDNDKVVSEWVTIAEKGNYEIVISNYCHEYPLQNRKKEIHVKPDLSPQEIAINYLKGTQGAYLWNKLIRSRSLLSYKHLITAGRDLWEDLALLSPLLYYSSRIGYYPKITLHYVHHSSSQYTGKPKPSHIAILEATLDSIEKEFIQETNKELHLALNSLRMRAFLVCCKLPFSYYLSIRKANIAPQELNVPSGFLEYNKKLMYRLASCSYTSFFGFLYIHGAVKLKKILRYIV